MRAALLLLPTALLSLTACGSDPAPAAAAAGGPVAVRAADDAAGLAIASSMTAQVRGMNQGIRNANDGISMIQTADGALDEVTNMVQRMRELARWNDEPGRTRDDVVAVLDRAAAAVVARVVEPAR